MGVLVVGITISVVEYLESSKPSPLAQEPVAKPVLIGAQTSVRPPAVEGAKAPRVVRANVRTGTPASAPAAGAPAQPFPSSAEASPSSAAPMTLQPDVGS